MTIGIMEWAAARDEAIAEARAKWPTLLIGGEGRSIDVRDRGNCASAAVAHTEGGIGLTFSATSRIIDAPGEAVRYGAAVHAVAECAAWLLERLGGGD